KANLTNDGSITATGVGEADALWLYQAGGSVITNNGTLSAVARGPGAVSYAINETSDDDTADQITNNGAMSADIALAATGPGIGQRIDLTNTGSIKGRIELGAGIEN